MKANVYQDKGLLILVVEDSPTQSALLAHLLEKNGFKVAIAANGVQGLTYLDTHKPNLIISDIMMPEMDGLRFCQVIKANPALRTIPIILMTSLEGSDEIGCVLSSGADNFIYKPYNPDTLISRINDILLRQQQQQKTQLSELLANRRAPPTIEAAEREGSLILVVEDSPVNQKLLMRQLDLLGYAAVATSNGNEALNEMKLHQYALVITDCNMPTMDGYELAMHIRRAESDREKPIQIIAYTANAMDSAAEACKAAGMDAHLLKPVEIQTLMEFLDDRLPIPSAAPIDLDVLYGIIGFDQDFINEVLLTFRRTNRIDSETLINALDNGNSHEVMQLAHRIKGASQMVGAHNLATICAEIELYCRESDTSKFNDFKNRYIQEMKILHQFLETIPVVFQNGKS